MQEDREIRAFLTEPFKAYRHMCAVHFNVRDTSSCAALAAAGASTADFRGTYIFYNVNFFAVGLVHTGLEIELS
jgi:hypothetical protein